MNEEGLDGLMEFFEKMDKWNSPYDHEGYCHLCGCFSTDEKEASHNPKCIYVDRKKYLALLKALLNYFEGFMFK